MKTNNNKPTTKILTILALLLFSYVTYSFFAPKTKVNDELEIEKNLVLNELTEMSNTYDLAIKESIEKDVNLEEAKQKIETLIDSLKITTFSLKELIKLKERQLELNSEMKFFIRENKELKQDNRLLVYSLNKRIDQLSKKDQLFASLKKEKESLAEEKEGLHKIINEAKFLTLLDLKIEGIKVRSSGKEILTDKAKRVDKFKICYAIAKNALIKESDKIMQVQVLDPNNNVLSTNQKVLKNEDSNIEYTFDTMFSYKNKNLSVCDYLELKEGNMLEKGTYLINIYDGKSLVTTSKIILK